MTSYALKKQCEVCGTPIPDDFGNLLCPEHYKAQEQVVESDEENRVEQPVVGDADPSIKTPGYKENPEQEDKEQVLANIKQFLKSGKLIWHDTRNMYTFVKNRAIEKTQAHAQFDKHIWKPLMVDVGCGSGVGSNILSWEADFVWGIDKNELSVQFAKEAFTREKNAIYYSSQVTFDVIDIMVEDRETMKFDYVVAIEVIEHIDDYKKFIRQLIDLFARKDKNGSYSTGYMATEFYISTPNRSNSKIRQDGPKNVYHVREWTGSEFKAVLGDYFNEVKLFNTKGEEVDENTTCTPVLAVCKNPK